MSVSADATFISAGEEVEKEEERRKEKLTCSLLVGTDIWLKSEHVSFFIYIYMYLHWSFLDSCLQSKFRSEKIGYPVVRKCQCCIKYARTDNKGSIISCFHPYSLLLSCGQTGKNPSICKTCQILACGKFALPSQPRGSVRIRWRVFIPVKLSGPDHRSVWRSSSEQLQFHVNG